MARRGLQSKGCSQKSGSAPVLGRSRVRRAETLLNGEAVISPHVSAPGDGRTPIWGKEGRHFR